MEKFDKNDKNFDFSGDYTHEELKEAFSDPEIRRKYVKEYIDGDNAGEKYDIKMNQTEEISDDKKKEYEEFLASTDELARKKMNGEISEEEYNEKLYKAVNENNRKVGIGYIGLKYENGGVKQVEKKMLHGGAVDVVRKAKLKDVPDVLIKEGGEKEEEQKQEQENEKERYQKLIEEFGGQVEAIKKEYDGMLKEIKSKLQELIKDNENQIERVKNLEGQLREKDEEIKRLKNEIKNKEKVIADDTSLKNEVIKGEDKKSSENTEEWVKEFKNRIEEKSKVDFDKIEVEKVTENKNSGVVIKESWDKEEKTKAYEEVSNTIKEKKEKEKIQIENQEKTQDREKFLKVSRQLRSVERTLEEKNREIKKRGFWGRLFTFGREKVNNNEEEITLKDLENKRKELAEEKRRLFLEYIGNYKKEKLSGTEAENFIDKLDKKLDKEKVGRNLSYLAEAYKGSSPETKKVIKLLMIGGAAGLTASRWLTSGGLNAVIATFAGIGGGYVGRRITSLFYGDKGLEGLKERKKKEIAGAISEYEHGEKKLIEVANIITDGKVDLEKSEKRRSIAKFIGGIIGAVLVGYGTRNYLDELNNNTVTTTEENMLISKKQPVIHQDDLINNNKVNINTDINNTIVDNNKDSFIKKDFIVNDLDISNNNQSIPDVRLNGNAFEDVMKTVLKDEYGITDPKMATNIIENIQRHIPQNSDNWTFVDNESNGQYTSDMIKMNEIQEIIKNNDLISHAEELVKDPEVSARLEEQVKGWKGVERVEYVTNTNNSVNSVSSSLSNYSSSRMGVEINTNDIKEQVNTIKEIQKTPIKGSNDEFSI